MATLPRGRKKSLFNMNTFQALQNLFRVFMTADESIIHKVHQYLVDEKILVPVPPSASPTIAPPTNITPINGDSLS
jgi:hypothetical protein